MRTTYHFSGLYQRAAGTINHVDGIATLTRPITDQDGYFDLKRTIVKQLFLEIDADRLTIQSLSILQQEAL